MTNRFVKRTSDGETIDIREEEAEQANRTARAKRVILTDSDGTAFSSSNPLNVDTELTLDGNVIIDNVSVFATDISDSSTTSFGLVNSSGHQMAVVTEVTGDISTNNSTTTVLDPAGVNVFTGTADDVSNYKSIGIMVYSSHASATDGCTFQFSTDGTNWDKVHSFTVPAATAKFFNMPVEAQFFRIVYTNGTTLQTAFRVETIYHATMTKESTLRISEDIDGETAAQLGRSILTGEKPDGDYTNVNVTEGGNLNISMSGEQNPDRFAWVNALGDQVISPRYRLVGKTFDGTTKDTNFWTETVTNGGTITQSGGIIDVETNTTANGTAQYDSVAKARFVAGAPLMFTGLVGLVNWETAGTADNVRRVGAYDDNDGFFFELDGTTFSIGTRKATVDTLISTGSFNGNLGASWTPTADTYYKVDIEYLPIGAFWYVNGTLLHKSSVANLTSTLTLPIRIENNNDNAQDTDVHFHTVGLLIAREGQLITNPTSYYHADGTTAGVNLKIGAGNILGVILNNCADNAVVTLSDSTSTTTPTIWRFESGKLFDIPVSLDFKGLSFSNGLRLTVATANASVTVIYE